MYDFKKYIEDKNSLLNQINKVKKIISEFEELGIDINDSIKKLDNAALEVKDAQLSIVLVGAFSDGKTSVAAGWINERVDNMKISSDESSDEILCYIPNNIPDGCRIVDTPGLFGNKVGADEEGTVMLLSDITKKYISEANLILYVVTAKNPIKDSHKECIKWIFKELDKASSTIFVINRMDDVADLTDEDDFRLQARIKSQALRNKLIDCGFSPLETEQVRIACISAAPNGKGIEEWEKYRDEYLRRSHLKELENMTNDILRDSRESLIAKAGCDVLNDEIRKLMLLISDRQKEISNIILPEKKESLKRNQKDLDSLLKRIEKSKKDIRSDLKNLKKQKVSTIRACSIDNFKDIMETEIGISNGKEGDVLNDEINGIYNEYVDKYSEWMRNVGKRFQVEYDKQNDAVENLIKKGKNGVALGLMNAGKISPSVYKAGIFAGRDFLGKIGVVIKFKPWQVTKMANFAVKGIPLIGAGIDIVSNIVENISEQEQNKKFEKTKEELINEIEEVFNQAIELLNNDEEFIQKCAPNYTLLYEQIQNDKKDIDNLTSLLNKHLESSQLLLNL